MENTVFVTILTAILFIDITVASKIVLPNLYNVSRSTQKGAVTGHEPGTSTAYVFKDLKRYKLYKHMRQRAVKEGRFRRQKKSNFQRASKRFMFSLDYKMNDSASNHVWFRPSKKNTLTKMIGLTRKTPKRTKFQDRQVPWNTNVLQKNLNTDTTDPRRNETASYETYRDRKRWQKFVDTSTKPQIISWFTAVRYDTQTKQNTEATTTTEELITQINTTDNMTLATKPTIHTRAKNSDLETIGSKGHTATTANVLHWNEWPVIVNDWDGNSTPRVVREQIKIIEPKPVPKVQPERTKHYFSVNNARTTSIAVYVPFVSKSNQPRKEFSEEITPRVFHSEFKTKQLKFFSTLRYSHPGRSQQHFFSPKNIPSQSAGPQAYFSGRSKPWREHEWSRGPTGPDSIYYNYYNDYLRSEQIGRWNTYVGTMPPCHKQVLDQEVPSYTSKGHWLNVPIRKEFYEDNFLEYLTNRLNKYSTWSAYVKANPCFTTMKKYYGTTKILALFATKQSRTGASEKDSTALAVYRKDYVVITEPQPTTKLIEHTELSHWVSRRKYKQVTPNTTDLRREFGGNTSVPKILKGIIQAYCYFCGIKWPHRHIGSVENCYQLFEAPANPLTKKRSIARWKCMKTTTSLLQQGDELANRKYLKKGERAVQRVYGPYYTGGCFKRWVDIGQIYNERGCRMWPPRAGYSEAGLPLRNVKGSYATERLMNLEKTLRYETDACVSSPHASLTPFSRSISLYARYHACVCSKRWCNAARVLDCERLLLPLALLVFMLDPRF